MKEENTEGFTTEKITLYKGYVSDMATEWWTAKDWAEYEEYVAELKRTGEYGKPEEYTVHFSNAFNPFCLPKPDENKPTFTNFALLIPNDVQPNNFEIVKYHEDEDTGNSGV